MFVLQFETDLMNLIIRKNVMYNAAIVGAGPAGIFTALELIKLKPDWKIILIEKGSKIEKRVCLLRNGHKTCPSCKTCGLLCGWGGAGAFSDGKLTLTPEVGGHLPEYMPYKDVVLNMSILVLGEHLFAF